MNRKANKPFIRWCILGAIGCGFMAAGDWLLGCIPLQQTDTGLFNRACYLSGSYGLWKPVLTVGLGAIAGFLYYFVVKALNADIDEKYRKTKSVQFLCGIFTVAIALTIHTWVATMAWFAAYLGPQIGAEAAITAVTAYQDDILPAILPIHDLMSPRRYGDMQAFVQKLRDMGYERVALIDTTDGSFMTPKEARHLMLRGSTLLVGRK